MDGAQLLSADLALWTAAGRPDAHQDEALGPAAFDARVKQPAPSWRRPRPVGAGLQNTGNSCYLNAALQCLTHTPPLAHYLLSREHSRSCRLQTGCTMCALEAHVTRSLLHSGDVIQPSAELTAAFHKRQQEDAHEFLMFLLNAMRASCQPRSQPRDALTEDRTPVGKIFGGSWTSQIECLCCRSTSISSEPFLDIVLDISAAWTVTQALADVVKAEELGGANAYHCGRCLKKVPASKTLTLQAAPKVLLLVLNRFSCFTGDKVDREVSYPQTLDMRPYMSRPDGGPLPYALYAVLVHAGLTCHSGHYYCYVKAGDGQWYKMDDSRVARCPVTSVLRESAYLLFYVQQSRVKKDSVAVPSGRVNQARGPTWQIGKFQGRELSGGFQVETADPLRHSRRTPTRELQEDRARVLREHKGPDPRLNPGQREPTLPANAVVIHQSRNREGRGRNDPEKENDPRCLWNAASFMSEVEALDKGQLCIQQGGPRAKKNKKKKKKRKTNNNNQQVCRTLTWY